MNINRVVLLCVTITVFVTVNSERHGLDLLAGYIPGRSGMPPINVTNCVNDVLFKNPTLSNALDCARTCYLKSPPKTCYYNFVIERYPTNGQACNLCTPNITNSICADCQCVPADGVERVALTVNRMIPGPSIQVCLGDYVVIDVLNKIKEDAITIHWHGIFQRDYQYYDGVPSLTQCPILYKNSFRYQFQVKNSGTHFWHAHTGLHKMDGVFGSLIVRDPIEIDPIREHYDTDWASHVVIINDWMNEQSTARYPGRNSGVTGQHPDSLLINGKGRTINSNGTSTNTSLAVITVEAGKRHRFRLINSFCTTCPGELIIEGHNLTFIATDGQPIKPVIANSIVSFPGERYDFVINANQTPGAYWIQLRALDQCEAKGIHQLGILQYADASSDPRSPPPEYSPSLPEGIILNPLDVSCHTQNPKAICVDKLQNPLSIDNGLVQEEPDVQFYVPVGFRLKSPEETYQPNRYKDFLTPAPGANVVATLDGITFEFPASPLVSQLRDVPRNQLCNSRNLPRGCTGNCTCTHVIKVPLYSVVEIVLVDESRVVDLTHPFHLHGYAFRVLSMDQPLGPFSRAANNSTPITVDYVKQLDREGKLNRRLNSPTGKDTIAIPNNGYVVLRFRANNPGFWLFHCHFVYHQLVGMELIIQVGDLRHLPPVPPNFPKCSEFKPSIFWDRKSPWTQGEHFEYLEDLTEPIEDFLFPIM